MTKKDLVEILHRRCRTGTGRMERPTINKADVESVLHHLGTVILEEVILKGDRVNLPNFGCAHAEWIGTGKKQLFAQFDWAKAVEIKLLEEKP